MNAVEAFAFEGHEVRTVLVNDEPWFVLSDLCDVLGLSNPSVVANRIDSAALSQAYISSHGQSRRVTAVSEAGMYEVVIRSDKPNAVAFRRWITAEVLPSIRKTGSYGTPALSDAEIVHRALAITSAQVEALTAQVEAAAPKVLFADAVATSKSSILVGELAKILKGNGVEIGATRLFARLREEGFLIKRNGSDQNMPTQYAMERGLFEIKETAITHSDGHVTVSKTPKVTGKGKAYFVNRFLGSRDVVVAA